MTGASPTPITPQFVFDYATMPKVNDYRCVVDAAGTSVIVERKALNTGGAKPQLFVVDLAGRSATSLLPALDETTRPDWCWHSGEIAFNYDADQKVGVLPKLGDKHRLFPSTSRMDYPTWFPDGDKLATESSALGPPAIVFPLPNTTTIDPSTGAVIAMALEGMNLYGGMPSVNQVNPNLIAFAGQPVGSTYDQGTNYIWVKDTSSPEPAVPLEYNCPATGNYSPAFQGRAPWWSPDGKWVVFESNRGCPPSKEYPDGMYAIYLYEYGVSNPAFAITDWSYNCNHAKWFPNGFAGMSGPFQLIVAAWQNGAANPPTGPYGLATLDLSPLNINF
jgi:WD40-like Beta Propeller Repeat